MTALEKQKIVKEWIISMCSNKTFGACMGCDFFNPYDETDGTHHCRIRDENGKIPKTYGGSWDMKSAMIAAKKEQENRYEK